MVNWYYVVGSERVGPVGVESLKQLFLSDEITLETYVWKKGFQNWERLKDVAELNFNHVETPAPVAAVNIPPARPAPVQVAETKPEPKPALKPVEPSSPEVEFSFDWNKVKDSEELFFVRIGRDRKNFDGSDIYGPYSRVELQEALDNHRVNLQTLIFAPGMNGWTKIQDTPMNEHFNGVESIGLDEMPLVLVFDYSPLPLVTVIKKAGTKEGVLLGAGPFAQFENKTVRATLYVGSELKAKNVQVKIATYDKKDQTMECQFLDMNQDAKRIMLNHAV